MRRKGSKHIYIYELHALVLKNCSIEWSDQFEDKDQKHSIQLKAVINQSL
jgi:hypothetical protein